jgi:hypothetical protein
MMARCLCHESAIDEAPLSYIWRPHTEGALRFHRAKTKAPKLTASAKAKWWY